MSEETNGNFWTTLEGLLTRVADISHNLTWSSLSDSIKGIFGSEPTAKYLVWKNDYAPCEICVDGVGTSYSADDEMLPNLPQDTHPLCRCYLDIQGENE